MLSRFVKLGLGGALVAGSMLVAAPAGGADVVIKVKTNDTWTPGHIFITKGDKATWKNPTSEAQHNVKSINVGKRWSLKRTSLEPGNGNKVSRTFKKTGKYWFRCTFDSQKVNGKWEGMVGYVHVVRN